MKNFQKSKQSKHAYFGTLMDCRQLVYGVIQSLLPPFLLYVWWFCILVSFLKNKWHPLYFFASLHYLDFGTSCKLQVLLNIHWTSSTCFLLSALPCDTLAFLILPAGSETSAWSTLWRLLGKWESPCKGLILSLLGISLRDFCPVVWSRVGLLSQLILSESQTAFQP